MAPKKKKNPKNDFYFFMQDQKKVFQREGRAWNNMEELVAMCHPLFKQLGEADKQRYKAMAKQWKAQDKLDLSNKFNHEGRSLLDIENERKAEEEAQMHIKRETLETVESAFAKGTLADEKFYIVHFNYLCEVSINEVFLEYYVQLITPLCFQKGQKRWFILALWAGCCWVFFAKWSHKIPSSLHQT